MSLQLYLGGSGAGKSRAVFSRIIDMSLKEPRTRFLILVPEQSTMEIQKQIVQLHPRRGILNIEVLSITRLAYRVFSETGYRREAMLEEIGKTFLLEKIALEKKEELPWFGSLLGKPEFLSEIKAMISEFLLYGVTPEELSGQAGGDDGAPQAVQAGRDVSAPRAEQAGKSDSVPRSGQNGLALNGPLAGKLRDLALLYGEFTARLEGSYMTAEELPERLSLLADQSALLRDSVVVLDGFTGFTPLQLKFLHRLFVLAREVFVTVTMDAERNPLRFRGESDLFRMSYEMVRDLTGLAEEEGIEVLPPVLIRDASCGRHGASPQLCALERGLFRSGRGRREGRRADMGGGPNVNQPEAVQDRMAEQSSETGQNRMAEQDLEAVQNRIAEQGPETVQNRIAELGPEAGHRPKAQAEQPEGIHLLAARNPREELRRVALVICRMIREEGYRYRDFAIVTGDLGSYGNYVREIFPELEIPYFIDEKRSLLTNPFIEYLRAALEAVSDQYSYSAVFRMLKTGIGDFDPRAVDYLENYVVARGIRGKKKWREPFIHHYRGEDPGELPALNALREEICALLDPLSDALAARGGTVREKTEALREFCLRSHAEEKLSEREAYFKEAGRPDLAREYAQVWPYVDSFLDKLSTVLSDERISMNDYRSLIEAGLGEARVGIIPPGNDRVLVGDMERSRLSDVKVLFFVGVNEGLIPKAPSASGVLSEAERTLLFEQGIRLKPTARKQLYIDRFYLYLTLTKPSDGLFLSWSLTNAAGEVLRPAYLVGLIRRMFPELKEAGEGEGLVDLVWREKNGQHLLVDGLSRIGEERPDGAYLELFSYYRNHPLYAGQVERLLHAARVRKTPDVISRAAARALYGDVLRNSASRLELFGRCRFAHFLAYGLKLKERQEYAFSGLDMGSILHRSLELFAKEAGEAELSWERLAGEDSIRDALSAECVRRAVEEYGSTLFADSARDRYQVRRMERLMRRAAWAQSRFLDAGDFSPEGVEADFMDPELLEAFHVDLPEGARMLLTGRIDRVDVCKENGISYVSIVDYKTGQTSFDLAEVYYGLQLQLAVYLEAAMEMIRAKGGHPVPAGMFYYRVQDPLIPYLEGETEEETALRRLTEHRASGVVLKDDAVLRSFDHELAPGVSSKVIRVALTKSGGIDSRRSSVLEEEAFHRICAHAGRTVRLCAERILKGHAEINPYEYGKETACMYCPYRGVCGFDRRIPGYAYRKLPSMKTEEILQRMEEELTGGETDREQGYGSEMDE